MSQKQDHFLDSKTILAIFLLVISWLGWNYYMKKKYPHRDKQNVIKKETQKEQTSLEKKKIYEKSLPIEIDYHEKEIGFKGEKLDILFSSKGFGIKKLKIKNYQDRKKHAIEFEDLDSPLFSTEIENSILLFDEIKKESSNLFSGSFSSDRGTIKKRIEVDEARFILNVQTEIIPKKEQSFSDLKISFSHAFFPVEHTGFLKMFFIYGLDFLRSFVFYEAKEQERQSQSELEKCGNQTICKEYSRTSILALGGKYFGKAFMNGAEILPKSYLLKDQDKIQAMIHYQFLHSKQQKLKYQIFLGPKSLSVLEKTNKNLKLWLDFGFFSWLARPILMFLIFLYKFCQNWGLAIILLTFVIRLFLLPINVKSYKSMKVMQKIQPEIKALRETYKSDPKKMNEEVMILMKKHKANPLGGCLPMFLQFPVFFALYRVLGESIELYQSPFFFWIQDLSLKDPYYILPILAGFVLFIQQSLTPMNLPKEQARLIKFMPLIFSVFMLNLPSGLTLYIFVSGLFSLCQQYFFIKLKSN